MRSAITLEITMDPVLPNDLYILSLFELLHNKGMLSSIGLVVMALIITWSLLEIITMLFNKKGRALHDMIAGTVVLRIKDK